MSNLKSIHATLVELSGKGILLQGKSGSGKSDLALRLIENKNAVLVADDVTVLEPKGNRIYGYAPDNIQGLLEVRGVGIAKYDFKKKTEISLVVRLVDKREDIERLPQVEYENILGVEIPAIDLYAEESSAPDKIAVKLNRELLETE